MRFGILVSSIAAGLVWLALAVAPAQSQADEAATCETCGQSTACPHCAKGKTCPHCASAKGKTCAHGGHSCGCPGKWGSHQWEYKCVRPSKKPEAMTEQFSGLGAEGWRLIEADGGIWCFSRFRRAE